MTSSPDDDEPPEGVRVDLPFIHFRMGAGNAGYGAPVDEAYEQARRKVHARPGFYRHLATYAATIGAVIFIDLITGGGVSMPVRWFVSLWGVIVGWQFLNTFVFPSIWSRETEDRMIEDELRRRQDRS